MSEEKYKLSRLITYLYETMNGELARDYAELDSENIELLLKELEKKDKAIERLHSIIKEVREWAKKYSCQFTNDDGELVVSEISFNIQARPCDLFKILDKEGK